MSHPRTADLVHAAKLARAVVAACPDEAARRVFAAAYGVGYGTLARAASGQALRPENYLALCAALGLDPVTCEAPRGPMAPYGGAVLWWLFGAAVAIARTLKGHDARTAAKEAGASLAAVSRAENGTPLSAANFLRLSAYAGQHPHAWTSTRDPARERCFTGSTQ